MDTALRPAVPPLPPLVRQPDGRTDPAQEFVTRMRAAAPDFAAAGGAVTAVVREVVPPARHRRSRCRVVLRLLGGEEVDLTFLGPVSRAASSERAFDLQIQTYLTHGRGSAGDWLVPDDEAPDGVAVDVSAWSATAVRASA
ncbi:hypothetical protein [Geodermatophilus sabuli]|uniref:Uncharacterized protein n=1 Tax=Geodermatophilus sabuli TaxID=1564158 RepID=A0A285EFY9_9ACTN|nr:hypothetical protein [Geodermatophilus sabuli]MBB3086460.1 hypothetical protein [Geodermatophilus sabuli]SNX97887.1 hypothetical protein SAMN06893097_108253 [Geodermatophilus sabuli]